MRIFIFSILSFSFGPFSSSMALGNDSCLKAMQEVAVPSLEYFKQTHLTSPRYFQKVTIVGAGPVGLLSAFVLMIHGIKPENIEIYDKRERPFTRAPVIQHGENSLFYANLFGPIFLKQLLKHCNFPLYGNLSQGFAIDILQRILANNLQSLGVKFHFGHEVHISRTGKLQSKGRDDEEVSFLPETDLVLLATSSNSHPDAREKSETDRIQCGQSTKEMHFVFGEEIQKSKFSSPLLTSWVLMNLLEKFEKKVGMVIIDRVVAVYRSGPSEFNDKDLVEVKNFLESTLSFKIEEAHFVYSRFSRARQVFALLGDGTPVIKIGDLAMEIPYKASSSLKRATRDDLPNLKQFLVNWNFDQKKLAAARKIFEREFTEKAIVETNRIIVESNKESFFSPYPLKQCFSREELRGMLGRIKKTVKCPQGLQETHNRMNNEKTDFGQSTPFSAILNIMHKIRSNPH